MEMWQGLKRPGGVRNTANIFGKDNLLYTVLLLKRLLGIWVSDFYSVKRLSCTKWAPSKSLCRSYIWWPCKYVHPCVTLCIIRPLFLTNSLKPHPVQWLPHNPSLFSECLIWRHCFLWLFPEGLLDADSQGLGKFVQICSFNDGGTQSC